MKNIIQSILSHIINTYLIQCLNFLDLFVRVSWSKWDIRSLVISTICCQKKLWRIPTSIRSNKRSSIFIFRVFAQLQPLNKFSDMRVVYSPHCLIFGHFSQDEQNRKNTKGRHDPLRSWDVGMIFIGCLRSVGKGEERMIDVEKLTEIMTILTNYAEKKLPLPVFR